MQAVKVETVICLDFWEGATPPSLGKWSAAGVSDEKPAVPPVSWEE